jgi:hypothetical protein
MKWNPFANALLASGYITAVVLLINYISSTRHGTPDTVLDGLAFLSLVVLSVATMGFLFFYRPTILILENKREEAVRYFLTTLATFAVITVLAITAMLVSR